MKNCPHCKATQSKNQPPSGTHCWSLVYDCGYKETWCMYESEPSDIESNCPFQTYSGYTTIKEYAEKHDIELPKKDKTLLYSDLYVDIYNTISDRVLHEWTSSDGTEHMMWHYNEEELRDYLTIYSLK
tara:strand:- start:747 stop:1130 length:384 start_codon:yes stop_codon:yes gene_type:complete